MRLIAHPLAPGRTSTLRALVGLIAAPTFAFVLIPLPLAFLVLGGDWGGERSSTDEIASMLPLIFIGYAITMICTLVIGGATWLALRFSKRESGLAYALAGAIGGLLIGMRGGFRGLGMMSVSQLFAFAICALTGALVALCFWLIAREPADPAAPAQ
jgi:hypothetical protein